MRVSTCGALLLLLAALAAPRVAADADTDIVREWAGDLLNFIRPNVGFFGPPGVARVLSIVTTCMFDALGECPPRIRPRAFARARQRGV